MTSVIRHCYVMSPKEFSVAGNEGDDIFLCEYEYDIKWHSFKCIAEIDNNDVGWALLLTTWTLHFLNLFMELFYLQDGEGAQKDAVAADDDWNSCNDSDSVSEEDREYDDETKISSSAQASLAHPIAANSRKGRIFELQKIGAKRIPEHVRCDKQTDLEKAKATLMLATLPKSRPCRDKYGF